MAKSMLSPVLLCAVALCLSILPSRADQIVNGGFELATPPANFGPGWVHSDPSNLDYVGVDAPFAHSGTHYAALSTQFPDTGSLSQTFATSAGAPYTLSFWLAHDVTITPSNTFSVFFNGVNVYTAVPNVGAFAYTNISISGLIATGTSTTVEFRYQEGDDFFRLDDVSVVPEPSVGYLLMLAAPMFGYAFYRRSRRTNPASA